MERWVRFGNAVSSKMGLIAPICVLTGVAFPEVFGKVTPFVPFLFAIMTFQNSLNNTFRSVADVFRRPRNLLIILALTAVVMPVGARLLAGALFGSDPHLVTGATLEYCVPVGVVAFMWVGMFGGNGALALAAILVSTVLSPFTIPLTLKILLGQTVHVDVANMMGSMLFMIAIPALIGLVVNDATHGWGHEKLSPTLAPAVRLLLILIITTNSTGMSDYVRHLTPQLFGMMAFIFIFASCGFALGLGVAKLLGQPMQNIVTMSFCTGLRNISAGAVIARQFFPGEVVFPVMMGTLFQQMLAAMFGSAMRRIVAAENARRDEHLGRVREALGSGDGASGATDTVCRRDDVSQD